jgi:hypothetical protein
VGQVRLSKARSGAKGRTEAGGGWQGVSESAVSDKPLLLYGLARNRRSPKRPSEPRPSGVHPEEVAVDRGGDSRHGLRVCAKKVGMTYRGFLVGLREVDGGLGGLRLLDYCPTTRFYRSNYSC